MGSFAASFTQGLMRGREEAERKRREAAEAQQRELGNQITGRNLALQDLELAKTLPAQTEQLPAGVQGPPQTIEQLINIPGVKALGIPGRDVKPVTQTDLRIQARADADVKQAAALDQLRAELGIRKESEAIQVTEQIAALFGGALQPGESVSPAQANLAAAGFQGQENRKSREAIAAENAAARRDAAAQRAHEKELAAGIKKAESEQDVTYFAQQLHAGEIALDEVPQKLRPSAGILADVLSRQQPGKSFASKKDKEKFKLLEETVQAAEDALSLHSDAYTGLGLTGGGFLPSRLGSEGRQKFTSSLTYLTSDIKHKLLGAAQSDRELKGIADMIPNATDSDIQVKTKLAQLAELSRRKQGIYLKGGAPDSASPPQDEAAAAQALIDKYR